MIFVYFNEQDTLVKRIVSKYVDKELPDKNDFNYVKLSYPDVTFREIVEEAYTLPLGEDRKIVVVDNASFLTGEKGKGKKKKSSSPIDDLIEYCKNPNMACDLIFMVYKDSIDETNELVKIISHTGTIKQVATPTEQEWKQVIKRFFVSKGSDIEPEAIEELYKRIDGDYSKFVNETNKLLNYANGEVVTLNAVRNLVSGIVETDVFALSNALIRGNKRAALKIYADLKKQSVDEVSLIGILANQFKFMDQVNYLNNRGMTTRNIANELKVNERRVMATLSSSLRGVNSNSLKKVIEDLYETSKSILTGKVAAPYAFKIYILNFNLR